MRRTGWVGAIATLGLMAMASAVAADDKIPLDQVPKAVMDAVKAKFPGAEITGAEKEEEDGKTIYEIALKDKGQAIDVSLKPDGTIVSMEKEITFKDLPAPVAKAVEGKYPKATIMKVEEVLEGGKTKYEVLLTTAAKKKIEVVLDPTGKILEEEDAGDGK